MARVNPGHPRLLVFNNPFQCVNGVLLLPNLLLESVKTFQDHSHVDTNLIDILVMTIDAPCGVLNLPLVIGKRLLFRNDISLEVRFQPIALKKQSVHGSKARKGRSCLGLQIEVLGKHPHVYRGQVTHSLCRLVETFVWCTPV